MSTVTVVLVGFEKEDELSLGRILSGGDGTLSPGCHWRIQRAPSIDAMSRSLRLQGIPVVLCNCDLDPSAWKELLELSGGLAWPPKVVVTSRLADERLWAEALNLGAYDVLALPFDGAEVVRTLNMVWSQGRRTAAAVTARSVA